MKAESNFDDLLLSIKKCQICAAHLPHGPRPVVSISKATKILIIGQAPGQKVYDSGVPWDDKSGDTLRRWLGVTKAQFLNPDLIGTMPMGFCYPGRNLNGIGDAPPRKECAPQWHEEVLNEMTDLKLKLIIGQYAIKAYFGKSQKRNLTETVRSFDEYLPEYFPLVHPSPLNFRWQSKNPWFEQEIIPILQEQVKFILS